MHKYALITALVFAGLALGCSGSNSSSHDKAGKTASSDNGGSTSLSVNTKNGAVSFDKSSKGRKTSISINSSDKK